MFACTRTKKLLLPAGIGAPEQDPDMCAHVLYVHRDHSHISAAAETDLSNRKEPFCRKVSDNQDR